MLVVMYGTTAGEYFDGKYTYQACVSEQLRCCKRPKETFFSGSKKKIDENH